VPCPFLTDIACHYVSLCRSLIFLPPPSFLFPSATGESTWDPQVFIIIIIVFPFWWLSFNKHSISLSRKCHTSKECCYSWSPITAKSAPFPFLAQPPSSPRHHTRRRLCLCTRECTIGSFVLLSFSVTCVFITGVFEYLHAWVRRSGKWFLFQIVHAWRLLLTSSLDGMCWGRDTFSI